MPDDIPEKELWRVQSAVASANSELARVIKQCAGMTDMPHPVMNLEHSARALRDVYADTVRAIDHAEKVLDEHADGYGSTSPRQIKSEHAERLKEQYDGPVLHIALQLLEKNRREWLHRKHETNGAQQVERHGLTENQRSWLNELQESWRAAEA